MINGKGRILFIHNGKFRNWKGTERFIFELVNFLIENGFEVNVIENSRAKRIMDAAPLDINIPFDIKAIKFKRIFGIDLVPKKEIKKIDPDIVYVTFLNSNPLVPSSEYKTIFGTHILHISFLKYAKFRERLNFSLKSFFLSFIVKFFWKNKDIVFHALNYEQRDWLVKKTHSKFPVIVIGNPVECTSANLNNTQTFKVSDKFRILYFGSLSAHKGFDIFLEIVKELEGSGVSNHMEFIIAGSGPLEVELIKLMKFYDNIIFIKSPSDSDKKRIMHDSDLFVYPSRYDNFPFTVAEAQIAGMPVLGSDVISTANIVINGETGFTLDIYELQSFIEKIKYYYDMWSNDKAKYLQMRLDISNASKRLCKENVLPLYLAMIEEFIQK
jgi:glycosyltransferase involved in cell wall biosynthesis